MPHANGDFNDSPPPQGTTSVQRRNLPPYSRPLGSQHLFDEDYFQHQLKSIAPSTTEADVAEDNERAASSMAVALLEEVIANIVSGFHFGSIQHPHQ
jgi:hypothetical protein